MYDCVKVHSDACVCMCVCIHEYVYVIEHVYASVYVYECVFVHVCTSKHTHVPELLRGLWVSDGSFHPICASGPD